MKKKKFDLVDFLKTYTAISHAFIDEYFTFYKACEIEHFGIKLENVLDYLELKTRKKFYDRFREKYNVGIDYVIRRFNTKSEKSEKNAEYYISFDTFEKICMRSKSKKADAVRDYFIILRKFIDYYKNHISEMILNKAKENPGKCVYIILVNKNKNLFKFGRTGDLRKRLQTYATGKDVHPDIKFIMLVEDPKIVEKCAKDILKKYEYKVGKEVYKVNIEVIKKMATSCAEMNQFISTINKNSKGTDAYIVYENKNITSIDYLNEKGKIIGYENTT